MSRQTVPSSAEKGERGGTSKRGAFKGNLNHLRLTRHHLTAKTEHTENSKSGGANKELITPMASLFGLETRIHALSDFHTPPRVSNW